MVDNIKPIDTPCKPFWSNGITEEELKQPSVNMYDHEKYLLGYKHNSLTLPNTSEPTPMPIIKDADNTKITYDHYDTKKRCSYAMTINIEEFRNNIISDEGVINYEMIKNIHHIHEKTESITKYETTEQNKLNKELLEARNRAEEICNHQLTINEVICDAMGNVTQHPVECLICNKQFINY